MVGGWVPARSPGDSRAEPPLRRWARNRLANNPVSGIARLDGGLLQEMAAIIGVNLSDMVRQLEMFTPRSAPQR